MSSTTKAFNILEALLESKGPTPLTDIARRCELPKPTVHRILRGMVDDGYVQANTGGRYSTGPRLLSLSGRALLHQDLRTNTGPILRDLQRSTGYAVHFAALAGHEAVYVEKIDAARPYQMASRVGAKISLHCTAVGKAILAALPPDALAQHLDSVRLTKHTDLSLTTRKALLAELDEIRQQDYSIDDEENERNVRCVGSVVYNTLSQVFGAVSISGLTFQFSLEHAHELGPIVHEAAVALSHALGFEAGRPIHAD